MSRLGTGGRGDSEVAPIKQAAVPAGLMGSEDSEHYTSLQAFIKHFSQDGLLPCPVVFHCLTLLLTSFLLPPLHSGGMYKLLSHLK